MYEAIASFLLKNCAVRPVVGIICGSGLSNLSDSIENGVTFKYEDIPGFPQATVPGHTGELVFGTVGGIECVCMRGRFHYYEGNSMERVVLPVRVNRRRIVSSYAKLQTNFFNATSTYFRV
jgi:purine-nucleoside phosphorylase